MRSVRALNSGKWGEISGKGNWRINALALFVLGVSGMVLFRLAIIQIADHRSYEAIAEGQYGFSQELVPGRGEIFLKSGNDPYPVAVNRDLQMAYAVPKEIKNIETASRNISGALGLDEAMLREKLGNPEDMYEVLKHRLSDEETNRLKELKMEGVYLIPESFRFYPGGELAAQAIGFVGSDGEKTRGRYGVESFWEDYLQGEAGTLNQKRDSRGRWISVDDRDLDPAEDGQDLILTINYNIQYEVEKILKEAVEKYRADEGSAIVMDPKTGRILAMANAPGFNLNDFSKAEDISVFDNPIVSGTYECGSVFKTITAAIGIDDGKISPETVFNDTGLVQEAGYSIKNSDEKSYGKQTMTEVLEKSLNTGAIFIEKQVGNKNFADYVRRFGFGEKTGIELPGELSGNIKNLDELKRNINFFTASFGQGISVTPIQLLGAYAAIANDGKLMKPQIVEKIIHSDGTEEEIAPQEIRRVIQESTARATGRMLRSVVTKGHGKRADVPGYLVGGKTGTAQVAKMGSKGYEEGLTIGSFAGFAPIDDPQFVILVKIDNPKDVQWAESTAAPVFGKIMKFVLEYGKIEPTEEVDIQKLNREANVAIVPEKPVEVKKDAKNKNDKHDD